MKQVAKIIIYQQNSILLQHRDNDQNIPYPNHWSLLGGNIEQQETPEQALQRELMEEIGLKLTSFNHLTSKTRQDSSVKDHIFTKRQNINTEDITLNEGQNIRYIPLTDLDTYKITPHYKEIIEKYIEA